MVSRKSLAGLNTLVERVTGLVYISKIQNTTADETTRAVTERLRHLPKRMRKTLTVDNGHENAGHEDITKKIKTKIFFAHLTIRGSGAPMKTLMDLSVGTYRKEPILLQ